MRKPKDTKLDKELLKTFEAAGLVDYLEYLQSGKRIMLTNFKAGVAKGLGLTLGMSVVLGVAAWILTILVDLPLIGEYAQKAETAIGEYQENTNYKDEFAEMSELLRQINVNTGKGVARMTPVQGAGEGNPDPGANLNASAELNTGANPDANP